MVILSSSWWLCGMVGKEKNLKYVSCWASLVGRRWALWAWSKGNRDGKRPQQVSQPLPVS